MRHISQKFWIYLMAVSFMMMFIAVMLRKILAFDAQAVTIFLCADMMVFIGALCGLDMAFLHGDENKTKITKEILRRLKQKTDNLYQLYPKDHNADKEYFK
jgi:uncharacterized membrane protein